MRIRMVTDGSCKHENIAWAFVALRKREVFHQGSGVVRVNKPDMLRTGSVIAELEAVCQAVQWAKLNHYTHITIVSDSQNVGDFIDGTANTSKYFIKPFVEKLQCLIDGLIITFSWQPRQSKYIQLAHDLARDTIDSQ